MSDMNYNYDDIANAHSYPVNNPSYGDQQTKTAYSSYDTDPTSVYGSPRTAEMPREQHDFGGNRHGSYDDDNDFYAQTLAYEAGQRRQVQDSSYVDDDGGLRLSDGSGGYEKHQTSHNPFFKPYDPRGALYSAFPVRMRVSHSLVWAVIGLFVICTVHQGEFITPLLYSFVYALYCLPSAYREIKTKWIVRGIVKWGLLFFIGFFVVNGLLHSLV